MTIKDLLHAALDGGVIEEVNYSEEAELTVEQIMELDMEYHLHRLEKEANEMVTEEDFEGLNF